MDDFDGLFTPDDRRQISLDEAKAIYFAESSHDAEREPEERERLKRRMDDSWQEFCSKIQPGDELWEFRSPPHKWKMLMGQHGIELLRNGELVEMMLISMN